MARPELDPSDSYEPSPEPTDTGTSLGTSYFGSRGDDNLGVLRHADQSLTGATTPPREPRHNRKDASDGTS